ncbi:MAG: hypothetical protein FWC41_03210, partial [Firmicutes bacterium]|nr:hypothetical protein [Bacillota bacterium]
MKRFLIKKKIAVVLSVIFFANVLNISPADINFAYAARKILKNKSIKREQSFFQKNPRLAKILKYFGISSAILISIFGLSYFVDKLNEKEKSECPHYKDMKELKNSIDSQINEAFKEVVVNKEDKERRDKKILDLVKDKKLVIELLEEAKKEAKLEEKPKNIKNVFIHLSVIGGLITIISGIRNAISEIGKLSKDIMQISYMRWA